jgi:hypothetical protein
VARLMRTMARTAVISGTAQATANAVNRRQMGRNMAAAQEAQAAVAPPAQAAAPPTAAPPSSMDEKLSQLERLSQLKAQGILSDAEFEQQKAAILQA